MVFLTTRIKAILSYLIERAGNGTPECVGTPDREVLFVLDGVGGFQFAPVLVRRALRRAGSPLATILYAWQFGLPGEIWTDLMWHRRNRLMGRRLARKLLAFRRSHPETIIHLLAFSGGAGIALFACEALGSRAVVETLVLGCPAMSPSYNLGPALKAVKRCYVLVSDRDRWILGLGTRIFGTTDRRFEPAAGQLGFRMPVDLSAEDAVAYEGLGEIRWDASLRQAGHRGGHTAWVASGFLRKHLLPLLRGEPLLPVHAISAHRPVG